MKGFIVKPKLSRWHSMYTVLYCTVCTGNVGLDCTLQTDGSDHAISAWHGCRAILGQPISVKVGTTTWEAQRESLLKGTALEKKGKHTNVMQQIHTTFLLVVWVFVARTCLSVLCGVLLLLRKSVELFGSSICAFFPILCGETMLLLYARIFTLMLCSAHEPALSEMRRDARWRKGRYGWDLWRGGHTRVYKTRAGGEKFASSFKFSTRLNRGAEPPFRENGVIRVGLCRERLRSWPHAKTELWFGVAQH